MLAFYLSYARGDDDVYVERFFDDLSAEVRVRAGTDYREEVGFMDRRSLLAGDSWSRGVVHALDTCRTFVALCTPAYFRSEACGREWSLFDQRLRISAGDVSDHLLPIWWGPEKSVMAPPPAVMAYSFVSVPGDSREGLRQLLRLQRHRDDYLVFMASLANRIVRAAEQPPVREGTGDTPLESIPSAFTWHTPVSRPRAAQDDLATMVGEAFTAAGRPLSRTRTHNLFLPGPVWVSTSPHPTADELRALQYQLNNRRVAGGEVGFFVHAGQLDTDVTVEIDRMRLNGRPVVTVPVRALRAALLDGRIRGYLDELERENGNRDNLFDTKNALTDERFLFGRDTMLNTIGSAITRDEHILVTGLRKVGKTSLLNVLRQHLVDQPVCMVDLQRFDRNHEEWPPALFRLMVQAFDRWGRAERTAWPFEPQAPASLTELEDALDRRVDHLGAPVRLIVVLDELERVFPARGEADAARRWVRAAGALRVLAQGERRHIALVGADLRPVANRENYLSAGTNPLFAFFQELPLPLLDAPAVERMVVSLAAEMGVHEVEPAFLAELYGLTGGHPSLTRTVAAEAHRCRGKLRALTVADLHLGVDRLNDLDAIGYFLRNNLWDFLTAPERRAVADAVGAAAPPGPAPESAALRRLGLLVDGRITIGLFDRWVREQFGDG